MAQRDGDGPLALAGRGIAEANRPRMFDLLLARDGVKLRCGRGDADCPTLGAYREELGCVLYPHMTERPKGEWPEPGLPLLALSSRWQRAYDRGDDPVHRPEGQRFGPTDSYVTGPHPAGLDELAQMVVRSAPDPRHPRRSAGDADRFFQWLLPGDPVAIRCPRCKALSIFGADSLRRQLDRKQKG